MDLGKPEKRLSIGRPAERVPAAPPQEPVTEPAADTADA
jgi:hypothetical protein